MKLRCPKCGETKIDATFTWGGEYECPKCGKEWQIDLVELAAQATRALVNIDHTLVQLNRNLQALLRKI